MSEDTSSEEASRVSREMVLDIDTLIEIHNAWYVFKGEPPPTADFPLDATESIGLIMSYLPAMIALCLAALDSAPSSGVMESAHPVRASAAELMGRVRP